MTSVVVSEDRGGLAVAARRRAINIAADAALSGSDLTEGQVEGLLEAAPLAQLPKRRLDELVSADGACHEMDTEAWYPPYGDGVRGRSAAERETERQLAASLCEGCPVQGGCLALSYALGEHGKWGVWGGLSEQDRGDLRPLWLQLQAQLAQDAAAAKSADVPDEVEQDSAAQAVA